MAWIPFERKGDYEEDEYRRHRTKRIVGACCMLLVLIIIILGLATLITYLVLRPRTTHYEIVSASVTTLKVLGASTSLTDTSSVDAVFEYGLRARNPNSKMSMEYSKFNLQTLYLGVDIGHTSVGGFRVDEQSAQTVTVTTSATNVVVNNLVGNALRNAISQGSVSVQVKIDTRARAHIGSYTSFWMWLHSFCDLTVTPPNSGVTGTLVRANCRNT